MKSVGQETGGHPVHLVWDGPGHTNPGRGEISVHHEPLSFPPTGRGWCWPDGILDRFFDGSNCGCIGGRDEECLRCIEPKDLPPPGLEGREGKSTDVFQTATCRAGRILLDRKRPGQSMAMPLGQERMHWGALLEQEFLKAARSFPLQESTGKGITR
jgi:hypothetical protein